MKKMLLLSSYVFVALISSSCSFKLANITASDCTAAHGGDPFVCWQRLRLSDLRPATGMSYHSAGTMSLAHATCVKADSQWWFHGAHIEHTQTISSEGNQALMMAYRVSYPKVADYLERVGALQTTRWTKLTGRDLNRLGVPLCSSNS